MKSKSEEVIDYITAFEIRDPEKLSRIVEYVYQFEHEAKLARLYQQAFEDCLSTPWYKRVLGLWDLKQNSKEEK